LQQQLLLAATVLLQLPLLMPYLLLMLQLSFLW
jgi:hypothetical protein